MADGALEGRRQRAAIDQERGVAAEAERQDEMENDVGRQAGA